MVTVANRVTIRNRVALGRVASRGDAAGKPGRGTFILALFLIILAIPVYFFIGTIKLSPYRVVLLVMFIPTVLMLLAGKLGPFRLCDLMVLLFSGWGTLALFVNHDFDFALQPGGILIVETVGPYALARYCIRGARQFEVFARTLFWLIVAILPFAIYENITSHNPILALFGSFASTFAVVEKPPRWGLDQAQGPFEHPILFGVYCGTVFGLALYVIGGKYRRMRRYLPPGTVAVALATSLSSGALTALITQTLVATWDRMTRSLARRWAIIGSVLGAMYVFIDLLSTRTPIEVFINYFTFNYENSYNRILIWRYGTAEVGRHPLFGIGLSDWERAYYMSPSTDMFWLLQAMQYGLPAAIFLAIAVIYIIAKLSKIDGLDAQTVEYRMGMLVAMLGFVVAGWTVDLWGAIYCLFFFFLGAAVWLFDVPPRASTPASDTLRKAAGSLAAKSV